MSISHQRRQGDGTVDGQMLASNLKPDLYKLARDQSRGSTLTPVTKTWFTDITTNDISLDFDGLYFGHFTLSLDNFDVRENSNAYNRLIARLYNVDDAVFQLTYGIYGSHDLDLRSLTETFTGFATSATLHCISSYEVRRSLIVSFVGYKVAFENEELGDPVEPLDPEYTAPEPGDIGFPWDPDNPGFNPDNPYNPEEPEEGGEDPEEGGEEGGEEPEEGGEAPEEGGEEGGEEPEEGGEEGGEEPEEGGEAPEEGGEEGGEAPEEGGEEGGEEPEESEEGV